MLGSQDQAFEFGSLGSRDLGLEEFGFHLPLGAFDADDFAPELVLVDGSSPSANQAMPSGVVDVLRPQFLQGMANVAILSVLADDLIVSRLFFHALLYGLGCNSREKRQSCLCHALDLGESCWTLGGQGNDDGPRYRL